MKAIDSKEKISNTPKMRLSVSRRAHSEAIAAGTKAALPRAGQAPLETRGQGQYRKMPLTGQAMAELAILGSFILLIIATLLTYVQRFEVQHQAKMEAFRMALQKAYEDNRSVSYTLKRDTRFINLFGGFGEGQPSAVSANASVMWTKGAPGSEDSTGENSRAYYQINDHVELMKHGYKDVRNYSGGRTEVEEPYSVWKEDVVKETKYASKNTKQESETGITNTKTADLSETVNTELNFRWDTTETDPRDDPGDHPPVYAYDPIPPITVAQGAYQRDDINRIDYSSGRVGTNIHREETWSTSH